MAVENTRLSRIWVLAKYDFKKKHLQKKLGLLWTILSPLFRIAVYYFVFTKAFQVKEANYALIIFSGLIMWTIFADTTKKSISLLRKNESLIESIPFNQLDLFLSIHLSAFFTFTIGLGLYLVLALADNVNFSLSILYLPILVFCVLAISLGTSLILAIIGIIFRDIENFWQMAIMAGFWTSGVLFKGEQLINNYPWIKYFNPFLGIITNTRNVLLYASPIEWDLMIVSLMYSTVMITVGLFVFKKFSHKAIDVL